MFLVEEGKKHNRESCKENVVDLEDPFLVKHLTRESAIEPEPELRHHKKNIFVESVGYQV